MRFKRQVMRELKWSSRIGRFVSQPHLVFYFLISGTLLYLLFLYVWVASAMTEIPGLSDNPTASTVQDLSEGIDKYCKNLDQRFYTETNPESESTLSRAKRAKLVRETLIYFPDFGEMWCLVPKAASTSWSRLILEKFNQNHSVQVQLTKSQNDTKPLQVILKELFGHMNKVMYIDAVRNEDVKKVLIARHPFARIASAYRDKLRDRKAHFDGPYFYQHYGAMIIRKYRKDHRIKQLEPAFPEFIDYLIDTDPIDYDEHWQPISILCGICHVKYHIVIKTESLEIPGHVRRLFRTLGFSDEYIELPLENTSNESGKRRHNGNESWISDYFKTIPRSKMVLLYKKYEMDFHVFSYSFLQYYFP